MTPAALRAAALEAAARCEWIKAADLKEQAEDLERAASYGRDPYNTLYNRRRADRVDPVAPTTTPEQRAAAAAMLAGSPLENIKCV